MWRNSKLKVNVAAVADSALLCPEKPPKYSANSWSPCVGSCLQMAAHLLPEADTTTTKADPKKEEAEEEGEEWPTYL